jgi:ABC-type multidrug transport system fused ATPase/permease subunit
MNFNDITNMTGLAADIMNIVIGLGVFLAIVQSFFIAVKKKMPNRKVTVFTLVVFIFVACVVFWQSYEMGQIKTGVSELANQNTNLQTRVSELENQNQDLTQEVGVYRQKEAEARKNEPYLAYGDTYIKSSNADKKDINRIISAYQKVLDRYPHEIEIANWMKSPWWKTRPDQELIDSITRDKAAGKVR